MPAGASTCGRLPCRPPQQPQAADRTVRLPDKVLWEGCLLSRGRYRYAIPRSSLPALAWTPLRDAHAQLWSSQPDIGMHLDVECNTMQPASRCHCEVEQLSAGHLQMCAQRVGDGMATKAVKWWWMRQGSTCWSAQPAASLIRQASMLSRPWERLLLGSTPSKHCPFERTCWRREPVV